MTNTPSDFFGGVSTFFNKWETVSSATTLVSNTGYYVDTSSGAFTVTLPASPEGKHRITIMDSTGSFSANNLTVSGNSKLIMGQSDDLLLDSNNKCVVLNYVGATGGWRLEAVTPYNPEDLNYLVERSAPKNLLHNGAMLVWQRGTTAFTGQQFTADRWWNATSSGCSITRDTSVPTGQPFNSSMKIIRTAGVLNLRQGIEIFGNAPWVFGQTYLTFSCWANFPIGEDLELRTGFQDTLGSVLTGEYDLDRVVIGEGTGAWKKYTYTWDSTPNFASSARECYVVDLYSSDTASTIYLTGLQLEMGDVATDFGHLHAQEEIALCERYYQPIIPINPRDDNLMGVGTGVIFGNVGYIEKSFRTPMRESPIVSYSSTLADWFCISSSSGAPTTLAYANPTKYNFQFRVGYTATNGLAVFLRAVNTSSYMIATADFNSE